MQPIPTPEILDPDRILDHGSTGNDEARAERLDGALHQSCSYAQQLWHDLDAVRGYLLDSLPPAPEVAGPSGAVSASPTGPEDDTGWANWVTAYAAVTSVLCGPRGDSGYGREEGRREAQVRRTMVVSGVPADHADVSPSVHPEQEDERTTHSESAPPQRARPGIGRTAATVVLVLLALRGLRPRRRTSA